MTIIQLSHTTNHFATTVTRDQHLFITTFFISPPESPTLELEEPNEDMAISQDQLRAILNAFVGVNGQRIVDLQTNLTNQSTALTTAIANQTNAATNAERATAKIETFSGSDNEDPIEWLKNFNRAAATNRWTTEVRKLAVAGGFLKGIAAEWYDANLATMNNNWNTGANNNNNFEDMFKARFANETKKNQWYQDLTNLRQATDESIDEYTNKFIKLADRVGINDVAQRKRMYLMGLNPGYTPLVYAQNPADFNAAVEAARRVEIGFNFASGTVPKKASLSTATSTSIVKAILDPTPVTNQEVDELTKKLEQLTVNYANLTSALLAQTATPQERRLTPRTTPRTITNRTSTITCYNCGKQGHIIRECPHPRTPRPPPPRRRPRFDEPRDLHYIEYDEEGE